jgi:glycosyl hydrolase family 26
LIVVALVSALVVGILTATPLPVRLYWGSSFIGTQFTGNSPPWDWSAVADFERRDAGGKAVSVLGWSSPFVSKSWCGGYCAFQTSLYRLARRNGVIPFFSWGSDNVDSRGMRGFTDAEIASGAQDAYIVRWAKAARAWGHPFFLRFDWEMNGRWFPWGVGSHGNTARDFVAMWLHVHDIFTRVGAQNVTWVWCPNIDSSAADASLRSLYPGDAYVDWSCLDGYNAGRPWTSFGDLFGRSYRVIAGKIASGKPMIIGETGSTEAGGSKARWISGMFSELSRFPGIRGLLWFEVDGTGPAGASGWPIESSPGSQTAFRGGIRNSNFMPNVYANVRKTPIPPP